MDETKAGVRTRAEALDMAKECPGQTKRRKVCGGELALSSSSLIHEFNDFRKFPQACISQGDATAAENESRCSNISSDGGASCCSSNESAEAATDHKSNSTYVPESVVATQVVSSTKSNRSQSGETTVVALKQQAEETVVPTSETSCCRHITVETLIPSEAELEEFFAFAEKNLGKQFTDKYNYDIFKDEPMSGRYDWVWLKP